MSHASLQRVAEACLHSCVDTCVADFFDGSSTVLDVFFYPGVDETSPSPCTAHEDKGWVTVIADNESALEVYDRQRDTWDRLMLGTNEVVVIANRELARPQAISRGERFLIKFQECIRQSVL
ncbi:hypothetical protein CYMTET_34144 [Cymbomonas tetramitiformis]|uniref:Uncharacterized protein n=1 Tax=Cymbomonas tetramitiformis TaxID=36881 RepID=A0AAE0FBS7_9CHLO|nr:hypothetical protein CYMTET_34144 [Cymbomonas tetramitiformis]